MAKSPVEKSAVAKPNARSGAKSKAAPAAAPAESGTGKLIFDGAEYAFDQLSEEARGHIVNLQACDQEINRIKLQLSIAQTARLAYAFALKQTLPAA